MNEPQSFHDVTGDTGKVRIPIPGPPAQTEIRMMYRNYRGEICERAIIPLQMFFGKTDYHAEPQWFIKAIDTRRSVTRDFAMKDCDFLHFNLPDNLIN